jgi:hypothetical protein
MVADIRISNGYRMFNNISRRLPIMAQPDNLQQCCKLFSYGYDLDDLYRYLLFNSSVGHNPNDGYHQVYDKTYDGIYQAVLDTNAVKYQR